MKIKIELVAGNSFEEIFDKLDYEHKTFSKSILYRSIVEPNKVSLELENNLYKLKIIVENSLDICFKTLYHKEISIYIFPTNDKFIIENMNGISGFAPYKNTIFLFSHYNAFKYENEIKRVVLHEFNHTCFYDTHDWKSLLDSFIAEGLADVYSSEILKLYAPPWSMKFSLNEVRKYWSILKQNLDRKDWHQKVFFGQKNIYPNWLGYSIGFQIVSLFREKYKNIEWKQVMKYSSQEILELSGFEKEL